MGYLFHVLKSTFKIWIFLSLWNIVDGNVAPDCSPGFQVYTVDEGLPVETLVKSLVCTDTDTGLEGQLSYTVTGGDTTKLIVDANGDVTTLEIYDYETNPKAFEITIDVADLGSPPLNYALTVRVLVGPINEMAPTFFFGPVLLEVIESATPGYYILNIFALDFDEGLDGVMDFTITGGNLGGEFAIIKSSGDLYLRTYLDYEQVQQYVLEVTATDRSPTNPLSGAVTVTVRIRDENDNPPVCDYRYGSVNEEATFAVVGDILGCTDADSGANSDLQYTIGPVNGNGKFSLSGNFLVTNTNIDYETETLTYAVEILVNDKGSPRLTGTMTYAIAIDAIDDNDVTFPSGSAVGISIPENTSLFSSVGTIVVADADTAGSVGSDIHFIIESESDPGYFSIDDLTGYIRLLKSLDKETTTSYTINFSAYSSTLVANKQGGVITVTVTDVNDNVPTFAQPIYELSLAEDTVPSPAGLITLAASDPDPGASGVTYSITGGNGGGEFAIVAINGDMSLASGLDYETLMSYVIEVTVTDSWVPPLSSTTLLVITVTPINEITPSFPGAPYSTSVDEDNAIGVTFFTAAATDGDTSTDGNVRYSITNTDGPFTVNYLTGEISNFALLDRETTDTYFIDVAATDQSSTNPKSSTGTITVTISDVNDNNPVCQPYHILRIPPAPTLSFTYLTIVCTDNDIGVNKDLDFIIQSGNTGNDFAINSVNGELQLANVPFLASYTLVVNVDDKGVPVLSDSVTVDVIIEQIPIYTNLPATFTIIEDTVPTMAILTVTSNVISSRARYRVTNGNTDSAFAIGESTGGLQLVLNVDREVTSFYNLTVELVDTWTGLNVDSYVEVTISDANDNVPKFDASFYAIQVLETVTATEILKVTVTDADDGVNAAVNNAIVSGNTGSEFTIDDSGSLQVVGVLDYETTSLYELVIEAVDTGVPTSLTGSATVLVSIQNANEFQPEFIVTGFSYQTTLLENSTIGATVYQVSAQDLDGASELLFKIASGNTNDAFSMNSVTGELYLGKPLDRETIDFYNLTLTVETPTGDTDSAIIEIQIEDVNDNDPMFSSGVLSLTVNEADLVGSWVTTFVTSDNDINNNAMLTLSITSGNAAGKFRITDNDLEINGPLDAASVNQYDLVATATDQGVPTRSSFILVYVFVQANTPPPDFNPNTDSDNFLESVPIGYTVYDANATTSGSTEGQANRLRYYIVSGNSDALFTIDIITGEVTTSGFFDRESKNSYFLDIEARDKDVGTLKDTLSLSITIDDVNDNLAVFDLTFYTGNVDEHSAINDVVTTVAATDADISLNGQVSYAISATPGSGDFSVDAVSGDIKVAADLDYLTKNSYYLLITAEDSSVIPQTSTVGVAITINDINDNTPIISPSTYTVGVSESASISDAVLLIQASDLDTGVNGDVVYSISTGNVGTAFAVDASGKITVANTLDQTITPTYVLTVIVADQGTPSLSATATVTMNVLDFNDNTPVLTNLPNTVYIRENDDKRTPVYQLMSSDADSGNNAVVTYYISSGNPKSLFDVDSASGLVTTLNFLTGETGSHVLTILAKDGGAPRRTATSTLTVNVLTDTAVIPSEFDFTTTENQVANTLVNTVTLDTVVHGAVPNVLFSITEGNINTGFSIGTDGKLFNTQPLDREFISDYYLIVHIEDLDTPPNSHDDRVHVAILDENDNIPIPLNPVLSFPCVENTPVFTDLQMVEATDADIGPNADLTFEIPPSEVQANIHFQIDSTSGMISVKTPPDYETATSFNFDLLIKDNGTPQNTGTVSVAISVIDVTDDTVTNTNITASGSVFVSTECSDVAESGDVIFTLTGDLYGLNAADVTSISYISFNEGSVFRADSVTGEVILNSVTSLRPHSEYILWVVALITFTSGNTQRTMTVIRVDTFSSEEDALIVSHELTEQQLKDLDAQSIIYFVKNGNADTLESIKVQKEFLTQDESITVIETSPGLYTKYAIVVAEKIAPVAGASSWIESAPGIAVVSIICIGLIILVALLVIYFFITKPRRRNDDEQNQKAQYKLGSNDHLNDVGSLPEPDIIFPPTSVHLLTHLRTNNLKQSAPQSTEWRSQRQKSLMADKRKTRIPKVKLDGIIYDEQVLLPALESVRLSNSKTKEEITVAQEYLDKCGEEVPPETEKKLHRGKSFTEKKEKSKPAVIEKSNSDVSDITDHSAAVTVVKNRPPLSPRRNLGSKPVEIDGKIYDGSGIDPKTGETYAYNTKTGEKLVVGDAQMQQLKSVNNNADARKASVSPASDMQTPPVVPYKLERVTASDNLQTSRSPSPNKQAPPVEAKEKVSTHRNSIQTNNKAGDKRGSTQVSLIGKKGGSTISVDSAYATSNEDVRADMKRAVTNVVKTK